MSCPSPIAEAVQSILALGLLRLRAAAWGGDAKRCAWEADHLHNLPGLLSAYSAEKLNYYWNVERGEFLKRCREAGVSAQEFERAWNSLQQQVDVAA